MEPADHPVRRPSRRLTFEDAVEIWPRILKGEFLHRIAADYDVNQGRISNIKTEKIFPGGRAVALKRLSATNKKSA